MKVILFLGRSCYRVPDEVLKKLKPNSSQLNSFRMCMDNMRSDPEWVSAFEQAIVQQESNHQPVEWTVTEIPDNATDHIIVTKYGLEYLYYVVDGKICRAHWRKRNGRFTSC